MKRCEVCAEYGVVCKENGIVDVIIGEPKGVTICLDGKPVLRTMEKIKECPVITKSLSQETVIEKIKETAQKLKGTRNLDEMGTPNF